MDWLFASFLLLFHNRICLDITEGFRGERQLRGRFGKRQEAASAQQSWRASLPGSGARLSRPQSRDAGLPFALQSAKSIVLLKRLAVIDTGFSVSHQALF